MGSNIGIVGATGAVGQEILRVLERRKFPVKNIRLFASERSQGKFLNSIPVEVVSSFKGLDIVFFCAGKGISSTFIPKALEEGCLVIDSSSAFRMEPHVPL